MTTSPFDSAIFNELYSDPIVGDLMSDQALIRAMLTVEAHLARVQGEMGIIPSHSASVIFEKCSTVDLSANDLAAGTASDGLPVPAFVKQLRAAIDAPEHAQYVHWGATSQDILDTGLVLRLKAVLDHMEAGLGALLSAFERQAKAHRTLPMAARTRNQVATPTSFGGRIAIWGSPFLRHLARLVEARKRLETLSFAGASGTLSALEGQGIEVADRLADSLGLARQSTPWHGARDNFAEIAGVLALICGSLGKFAEDLLLMGQSELREVALSAGGGSSTMPHKSNPVGPETIVTLSRIAASNLALMNGAMAHKGERDGSAWGVEWHALPQIISATAGGLRHSIILAEGMVPDAPRMLRTIEATNGLMFAEAATFALANVMPRPDAQELVKTACKDAVKTGADLREVLEAQIEVNLDWDSVFAPEQNIGVAAEFADRFVDGVTKARQSFKF